MYEIGYITENGYTGKKIPTWYGLLGHTRSHIGFSGVIDACNHPACHIDAAAQSNYHLLAIRSLNHPSGGIAAYDQALHEQMNRERSRNLQATIGKMHAKLHSESSSALQGGTFVAEMPGTIKYLASCLTTVAEARKFFNKGWYTKAFKSLGYRDKAVGQILAGVKCRNVRQRRRLIEILARLRKGDAKAKDDLVAFSKMPTIKAVANKHLAFTYGALPIYADCQAVYGEFSGFGTKDFSVKSIYKSSTSEININRSANKFESGTSWGGAPWTSSWSATAECRIKIKTKVTLSYRPVHDGIGSVASYYACDNLATIVWEKLPYSFVVDWFVPMKRFFTSLKAPSNVQIGEIWASSDVRISARIFGTCIDDNQNGHFVYPSRGKLGGTIKLRSAVPVSSFYDPIKNLERTLGNIAAYGVPSAISMWLSGFEMFAQRFGKR